MHIQEVSNECFLRGQGDKMGQNGRFCPKIHFFLSFLGGFGYRIISYINI